MTTTEQRREFRTRQGLVVVADCFGRPEAPPVLLLHGGGQTRFAWGGAARRLAAGGYYAVALDARGHGESDWAGEGGYSLDAFADDVDDVISVLGTAKTGVALVGASLGGMTALVCTSRSSGRHIASVVLVDITPNVEPAGVERIINFMRAKPDGFASLDEAADAVAEFLPHRRRPDDTTGLAKNLREGSDGRYHWHWDPAFLVPRDDPDGPAAAATPARLERAAKSLSVPTLLVRGGSSDVVSEKAALEFARMVPHAELFDVAGAAHMVAGDRNDPFSEAVVEFLVRVYPGVPGTAEIGNKE